jgi:hypothetical protein
MLKSQLGKESVGSKRIENIQSKTIGKIEDRTNKQKGGGVSR